MTTTMLAVLGSGVLLSSFVITSVLAQDAPYNEEYMQQHDGGDRDEYLQEMGHSDLKFYVPPMNDGSVTPATNNLTTADN